MDIFKQPTSTTGFFVVAVLAALISSTTQAGQWRDRAIYDAHNGKERDFLRFFDHFMATTFANLAANNIVIAQLKQDELKKFQRNVLRLRDNPSADRAAAPLAR